VIDEKEKKVKKAIPSKFLRAGLVLIFLAGVVPATPAAAQDQPNILFIFGDDIGMFNVSAYHRGMMGGSTPNIDRIANEGALFTDYYVQQS